MWLINNFSSFQIENHQNYVISGYVFWLTQPCAPYAACLPSQLNHLARITLPLILASKVLYSIIKEAECVHRLIGADTGVIYTAR